MLSTSTRRSTNKSLHQSLRSSGFDMCNVSFSHTVNSGRSHIASDFVVLVLSATVLVLSATVLVLVLAGCLTCYDADR